MTPAPWITTTADGKPREHLEPHPVLVGMPLEPDRIAVRNCYVCGDTARAAIGGEWFCDAHQFTGPAIRQKWREETCPWNLLRVKAEAAGFTSYELIELVQSAKEASLSYDYLMGMIEWQADNKRPVDAKTFTNSRAAETDTVRPAFKCLICRDTGRYGLMGEQVCTCPFGIAKEQHRKISADIRAALDRHHGAPVPSLRDRIGNYLCARPTLCMAIAYVAVVCALLFFAYTLGWAALVTGAVRK